MFSISDPFAVRNLQGEQLKGQNSILHDMNKKANEGRVLAPSDPGIIKKNERLEPNSESEGWLSRLSHVFLADDLRRYGNYKAQRELQVLTLLA